MTQYEQMDFGEKIVESWELRNDLENDANNMTECARSAVILDGE